MIPGARMSGITAKFVEGPGEANTPTRDAIESQLAKILNSGRFLVAERLRDFLEFVVRQQLKGNTDQLKEYTIGLAVFGKKPDFDPGKNAVVRTAAARLRNELEAYYKTAGKDDPILIEVPKGRYIPQFSFKGETYRTSEPQAAIELAPAVSEASGARFFSKKRCAVALLAFTMGVGLWVALHGRHATTPPAPKEPRPRRLFASSTSEGHSPRRLETGQRYGGLLMAPDGKTLYAISSPEGRSLAVIGTEDLLVKRTVHLPLPPRSAFLSRNGKHIYISSLEYGVMEVNTGADGGVPRVIPTDGPTFEVAVTPDEKKLFLAMGYAGLKRISLQTSESRVLSPLACPVSLNINPSGKRLYVSYQCGGPSAARPGHDVVDIYDVDSEQSVEVINSLTMVGGHTSFAPQKEDLVLIDGLNACSSPGYDHVGCLTVPSQTFYLWRASDRRAIATLSLSPMGHTGTFFPQGTRLAFSGADFMIWDWARQMALETIALPGVSFHLVALTPNGDRAFVSMGDSPGMLVFDAEKEECLPPIQGLTNWYTGDGTRDDSQGSAALTFVGQQQFVPGLMGQAFSLDAMNSFLLAKEGAAFCPFCAGSWSMSFFVKFRSTAGEMSILDRESTNPLWDLRLFKANDNRIVLTSRGDTSSKFSITSRARINADRWYHLAVIIEKDHRSFFVDGALQGELRITDTLESPGDGVDRRTIFLGATQGKRDFLNGVIDEIAVYNRALAPSEVIKIAEACGASKSFHIGHR